MENFTDLYTDYLLSSTGMTTATGFSQMIEGQHLPLSYFVRGKLVAARWDILSKGSRHEEKHLQIKTSDGNSSGIQPSEFISAIDDYSIGHLKLIHVTETKTVENRNYRVFNFFSKADKQLLLTLIRSEFNIYGFRSKELAKRLRQFSPSQLSRILKQLRVFGLIKKVGKNYKYYLAHLGKDIITCSQKVINLVMIPQLAIAI